MTANAYSFLTWLRTGLATQITQVPGEGAKRASIQVRLRIKSQPMIARFNKFQRNPLAKAAR